MLGGEAVAWPESTRTGINTRGPRTTHPVAQAIMTMAAKRCTRRLLDTKRVGGPGTGTAMGMPGRLASQDTLR
jgi:hypothetical protein